MITDVCLCHYTSHGHCGLLTADGRVEAHTHEITATGTLDPAAVPGGLAFGGSARVLEHSQMRTYILTSDRGDVYFLEMNRCGHGDLYHGNTWVDAMGCGGPEVSDFVRRMGADCDGD